MSDNIKNQILNKQHYKRLRFYFNSRGQSSIRDAIDLDLAGLGLIIRQESYERISYMITAKGEKELYEEKQREIKRRSPHHDLGSRLAHYLRENGKITWENIEFKIESFDLHGAKNIYSARPDVFSMSPTYNEQKMNPIVYEVKVSRSDFLSDINKPEKRTSYQQICEQMYYVSPSNIIKIDEVPMECGLIHETKNGEFTIIKKIKKRKVVIPAKHFMNLILKKGKFNSYKD